MFKYNGLHPCHLLLARVEFVLLKLRINLLPAALKRDKNPNITLGSGHFVTVTKYPDPHVTLYVIGMFIVVVSLTIGLVLTSKRKDK